MVKDLKKWISNVEEIGQLKRINGADPNLEMGTIAQLNAKAKRYALLFENIKGYPPDNKVITATLSTPARLALTLGLPTNYTAKQLTQAVYERLSTWEEKSKNFKPREVASGAVMENISMGGEVDILKFPSPLWHEADGGRYIGTGAAMVIKDPETGIVNLGCYRIMVHDKNTLGFFMAPGRHGRIAMEKYHARGESCPVVVTFGHDPLIFLMASTDVPLGISEYNYAGAILGAPLDVVNGEVTGLPIPASSEIAVEGFIPPGVKKAEGPFGEFTGYYGSGQREEPIIKIEAVYYQNNRIIVGSPCLKPPSETTFFHSVFSSAHVLHALKKAGIPDVKGVWFHEAGSGRMLQTVSIKQRYAGHAKQAGAVASNATRGHSRAGMSS